MKIQNPAPLTPMAAPSHEDKALREVSRQFEAVFLNQLVSAMRKTVTKSEFLPESQGEKIYQAMLDEQYATKMAESGQIGLSNLIYSNLTQRR